MEGPEYSAKSAVILVDPSWLSSLNDESHLPTIPESRSAYAELHT